MLTRELAHKMENWHYGSKISRQGPNNIGSMLDKNALRYDYLSHVNHPNKSYHI